jgi:hypothetical protein
MLYFTDFNQNCVSRQSYNAKLRKTPSCGSLVFIWGRDEVASRNCLADEPKISAPTSTNTRLRLRDDDQPRKGVRYVSRYL